MVACGRYRWKSRVISRVLSRYRRRTFSKQVADHYCYLSSRLCRWYRMDLPRLVNVAGSVVAP